MDNLNYFKDLFESISEYRKIVLIFFLIISDADFLKNRTSLEFKNILLEQNEEYLEYIKKEEESIIQKILNK